MQNANSYLSYNHYVFNHYIIIERYLLTLALYPAVARGLRGRDRMVVGFTTTYAISAYHH